MRTCCTGSCAWGASRNRGRPGRVNGAVWPARSASNAAVLLRVEVQPQGGQVRADGQRRQVAVAHADDAEQGEQAVAVHAGGGVGPAGRGPGAGPAHRRRPAERARGVHRCGAVGALPAHRHQPAVHGGQCARALGAVAGRRRRRNGRRDLGLSTARQGTKWNEQQLAFSALFPASKRHCAQRSAPWSRRPRGPWRWRRAWWTRCSDLRTETEQHMWR